MEIHALNVNDAYANALRRLKLNHTVEDSRNGPVWVFPEPVMTIYESPLDRVLFSPLRDANPWFHVMESLWMLAGRNDVAWPAYFAKNIANYSDDGKILWGGYGARWRFWFGYDQLPVIINELKLNRSTRRCVLTMWDANIRQETVGDLHRAMNGGKDVPCNTHIYFDVRQGALNMTVLCRSNDLYYGCYGANAVHFSFLQEFMAAAVGVPVGGYRQFSNNLHLYTNVVSPDRLDELATDAEASNEYLKQDIPHYPLVQFAADVWLAELDVFMGDPQNLDKYKFKESFFHEVAIPMYRAWCSRKQGHADRCEEIANEIAALDWRIACNNWLARRKAK
jgi:thymidylate synthase